MGNYIWTSELNDVKVDLKSFEFYNKNDKIF